MLESDLRALFERQAASESPPAPVSIPAAQRIGRIRLRRRRAGTVASPLLAVGAVVVVALSGAISPGATHPTPTPNASRTPHPSPTRTQPAPISKPIGPAPRQFNPLVEYASFGWLPFSKPVIVGGTGLSYEFLEASSSELANTFNWTANAAGTCRLAGKNLSCQGQSVADRMTSRAPDIDGHVAYWGYVPLPPPGPVNQILAYQYARGGWATIEFVGNAYHPDALKIAQNMRLGQRMRLRFAVQLTGLSARWHLTADQGFDATSAGPLDKMFGFTSQPRANMNAPDPLEITAQPASIEGVATCTDSRWSVTTATGNNTTVGPGTPQVIDGYHVYVNSEDQILCADDVHGLSLQIQIDPPNSVPALNVVSVFTHHLRILGTDPANWTTDPIGP